MPALAPVMIATLPSSLLDTASSPKIDACFLAARTGRCRTAGDNVGVLPGRLTHNRDRFDRRRRWEDAALGTTASSAFHRRRRGAQFHPRGGQDTYRPVGTLDLHS